MASQKIGALTALFLHSWRETPKWSYQPCHPCTIVVTVILHVLEAQPFGREGGADHAAAAQLALRRAQVACGRAVGRDRVSRRLGEERDQYLVGVWG